MIRVLLVDDQELVRAGLAAILRPHYGFEVVGQCGDGSEALSAVVVDQPDVVVMDVRMPRMSGVEATRRIRASGGPPVLVLTTFDDDETLAGAIRAGAAGFLLKDSAGEDIQRAVRTVAEGGAWLDPTVTGRVLATFREAPARATDDGRVDALTPREREVLCLIGRGLSNQEIARHLVVGEGTVKTHIGRIFTKLDLRDRAAAVVFAFDHGLVRPGG